MNQDTVYQLWAELAPGGWKMLGNYPTYAAAEEVGEGRFANSAASGFCSAWYVSKVNLAGEHKTNEESPRVYEPRI